MRWFGSAGHGVLDQSFSGRDEKFLHRPNGTPDHPGYRRIAGRPRSLLDDYRFLEQQDAEEEIFFRRNGRYRSADSRMPLAEVYLNKVHGSLHEFLLLGHVLWTITPGHGSFEERYLASLPETTDHLEIGPGLAAFAFCGQDAAIRCLTGWMSAPRASSRRAAA